jgi:hypothetical protein
LLKSVYTMATCRHAYWIIIAMEQYNSTENKNIERENTESAEELGTAPTFKFPSFRLPFKTALKKVVSFVCYGPGVLGFLWLIGRILKR